MKALELKAVLSEADDDAEVVISRQRAVAHLRSWLEA
jgi:hypothetical protein